MSSFGDQVLTILGNTEIRAEVRIASAIDFLKGKQLPLWSSSPGTVREVEAFERGFQQGIDRCSGRLWDDGDLAAYGEMVSRAHKQEVLDARAEGYDLGHAEGFKKGVARRKGDGKNVFEAGKALGRKEAEKEAYDRVDKMAAIANQASRDLNRMAELKDAEVNEAYVKGHRKGISDTMEKFNQTTERFNVPNSNTGTLNAKPTYSHGYNDGYVQGKAQVEKLQQRELNEHFTAGYNKGMAEFKEKYNTHDEAYQNGYQAGVASRADFKYTAREQQEHGESMRKIGYEEGGRDGMREGFRSGVHTGDVRHKEELDKVSNDKWLEGFEMGKKECGNKYYFDGLEKGKEEAKNEYAAEVLKLVYKYEQELETKWQQGRDSGKEFFLDYGRKMHRQGKEEGYADGKKEAYDRGFEEGKLVKVRAITDKARTEAYENGLKDGHFNGLQEAAKAVDGKILQVIKTTPALQPTDGIPNNAPRPPWERNQAMADTSNWDMRERTVKS